MLQVGMETCIKNVILGQKRYFLQSFWDHMDPCAYLPKWSRYVPGMDGFTRTKEPWERAWTFFTLIVTFNFYHKCIHLFPLLVFNNIPTDPYGIYGCHLWLSSLRHSTYKREKYAFINWLTPKSKSLRPSWKSIGTFKETNIKVQTLFINIFMTLFAIQ